MKATRNGDKAFTIEFESEDELREEVRTNLAMGGLRLLTGEPVPLHARIDVTLRTSSGIEASLQATVVAPLPDGVALAIEGDPGEIVTRLVAPPEKTQVEAAAQNGAEASEEKSQNVLDRLRALTRTEKIIFAAKADRVERAFLIQDIDPQVLGGLLRNPRLTIEEVIRLCKSSHLIYQTVDVIMKTGQWTANVEVRLALIHNPKTPPQVALRILPTLPESEVRTIARGAATSMALKTAALRHLQRGS